MKRALPIQVLLGVTLLSMSAVLLVMLWFYQQQNALRSEYTQISHQRLGVSRVLFAVEDRAEQMQRLARLAASTGDVDYISQHARLRQTIRDFHELISGDIPAHLATPRLDDADLRDWTGALTQAQLSEGELARLSSVLQEILDWSRLQAEAIAPLTADQPADDILRLLSSPEQELSNWRNGALLEDLDYQVMARLNTHGSDLLRSIDRIRRWEAVNLGLFALFMALGIGAFQALAVRPLKKALHAATQLGNGSYEARLVPEGVEETRTLGRTLNWMADAIQADIEARLQAEVRAREAEARIRQVGDLAPGAIWSSRWTREGGQEVFYISEGFDTLYALGGETIRRDFEMLYKCIHPDDRELTRSIYERSARDLTPVDFQHRTLRPEGDYRWTRVVAHVSRLEGGGRGWNGFCMDVDEIQRLRESTESALQRAQAASQAKTAFLANISHEVRTPLNAIIGIADVALLEKHPPDLQRKFERIQNAGRQLLRLLNDILDTSKLESGRARTQQQDFEPRRMVQSLRELHEDSARAKGIELRTIVDAGCPHSLRGDPLRLQQILGNLLSNAIKFTVTGEVRLHAQLAMDPRRDASTWLRFTVSDTGPGISPENQHLLFEPFTQEDDSISRTHGGTGLGLTISRQLTELLGGEITVDSALGRGSHFIVTLPFAQASKTTQAPREHRSDAPSSSGTSTQNPTLSREQIATLAALIEAGDASARTQLHAWFGNTVPTALTLLQQDLDSFDFERAARRLTRLQSRAA